MKIKKCLSCYKDLKDSEQDFHPKCSRKLFDKSEPPLISITQTEIYDLAKKIISTRSTVTGVQPKLSLNIEKLKDGNKSDRFTLVGLIGDYILKPPSEKYPELPEVEDLTMHLADLSKIKTVPHSLIKLKSGEVAYITKRIDRTKTKKLHMEDMCQLTERLTEHKYHGSYEQIAKVILKYSQTPFLDIVNFYEIVLFSFLTGNSDMHLKNFSLIDTTTIGSFHLAPAYDLVATALVNPDDKEELALTLNGKKKNICQNDFLNAFKSANLEEKVFYNLISKFESSVNIMIQFIDKSFLSLPMKTNYKKLILHKAKQLEFKF